MFDLKFYTEVCKALAWTGEAPGVKVLNESQTKYHRNTTKFHDPQLNKLVMMDKVLVRTYVIETYLDYFDLKIKDGMYKTYHNQIVLPLPQSAGHVTRSF